MTSGIGSVSIRHSQVVQRGNGGALTLLYVPDDRYVSLDGPGRAVWEAIASGETSIDSLIATHAKSQGLNKSVAAYQVVSFLDELRSQGFVSFDLDGEQRGAPLLDTLLTPMEERVGVRKAPSIILPGSSAQRVLTFDRPERDLALFEMRQFAERTTRQEFPAIGRVIVVSTDKSDLSATDIEGLAEGQETPEVTRLASIENPRHDATIADLTEAASGASTQVGDEPQNVIVVARKRGPVIIIVIIIVVRDPTGPASGKSRSACKTMCV